LPLEGFIKLNKMMRFVLTVFVLLFVIPGFGQKLTGQWTGVFNSGTDMLGGKTEYVLELEIKGSEITGYSYTYFNIVGKRCYVICRLQGEYEKQSKSMVVKEVEKVKSNTPPDFKDCLQTHLLTYLKSEGKEVLVGKWKPTYDKDNCGAGQTELERKQLVKVVPQSTTPPVASKSNPPAKTTKPPTAAKPVPNTTPAPTAKTTPPKSVPPKTTPATPKAAPPVATTPNKPQTIDKTVPSIEKPTAPSTISGPDISKIDRRSKQIIKTIEVDSKAFRVDMYDNGQIDGDTISLYMNGKLLVSRQRLSTTPISLNINLDDSKENELIMYAENLGTIPPNTALMVVTVGDKRFEVNITSSEQTNGAVRFLLRK
jgi:hypothetical protein